jgi:predicted ATPase/class 3 adenylate cyclase
MPQLPSGTLTLLFTDVEASTRLLAALGRRYGEALNDHRLLLRQAVSAHGGVEVDTQGDAFFCVFTRASDAVVAAAEAQRAFAAHPWPEKLPLRVRMGIHTGEPTPIDEGYVGLDLHKGARVMGAGHGGQVLISEETAAILAGRLPSGLSIRDLGSHRLKDLTDARHLYQLVVDGLPSEFPPLKTLSAQSTNLPVQPTPFMGRGAELAELSALLRREEVRLLTLTGPGGTGKTRLALQAAADALDLYRDGVIAVFLAPVRDPALLLPAVAQTLGLREAPGLTITETVTEYLAERELLLVLDNLEHLLAGVPSLAQLLGACPKLTLLATTRVALRLSGEQRYPVPPLSLPEFAQGEDPDALRRSEAVALFYARAQAVKPDFSLTAENAGAVAQICHRLDGLPLALELAAARIPVLPPPALLARLERRLALLTGGSRDADERQRTLRATIDWSDALLDERERALFARLAVFVGGFALDAAEAVCAPEGDLDVLEGVSSLLEKSLLRERQGLEDESRFYTLETVREFAEEKLEERGETGNLRRRHAEYFLAIAEESEPKLKGPEQLAWLERLDTEHDNLREALRWAIGTGNAEIALRFAGSLYRFWDYRGHLSEGLHWVKAALALEGGTTEARARALFAAGFMPFSQGDLSDSISFLEHAVMIFRGLGDTRAVANALVELAYSRGVHGEEEKARLLVEEGLELARAVGDRWCVANALGARGAFASTSVVAQATALREGAAIFIELGDEIFLGRARTNLGWLALLAEEYEEAGVFAHESLVSARRFADFVTVGINLGNLALSELLRGDLERAVAYLREGLELARRAHLKRHAAEAVWALGGVAAASGDVARAGRLHGAAEMIYESIESPPTAIDRRVEELLIRPARAADAPAFDAARAEGRAMSFGDALAYALEEAPAETPPVPYQTGS